MAITTGLKKSDGVDLGNNLFAGNGSSSGNQTFNILQSNGIDLGRGWYNKSSCSAAYGNIGFKNAAGVDVGTLLGKYGTLNCDCDCTCDCNCDSDTDGCFVSGSLLTKRGLIDVSQIEVGDELWGTDEKWHTVLGVASNIVSNRRCFKLPNGGVVTEDHVIYFGELAYVPSEKCLNREAVMNAENGINGRYFVPNDVQEIDGAIFLELPSDTKTFSPIIKGGCIAYFNGDRVLVAGAL